MTLKFLEQLRNSLGSSDSNPVHTPPQTPSRNDEGPSPQRTNPSSPPETSSTADILRNAEKVVRYTVKNPASVAIEYTSKSTHNSDMMDKWVEYALVGISIYIIIDSHDVWSDGESRIILGFLNKDRCAGCKRQYHGFPEPMSISTISTLRDLRDITNQYESQLYHKLVFTGDERIDFDFLRDLYLTANQMQSPSYLRKRLKMEWRKRNLSPNEVGMYKHSIKRVQKMLEDNQNILANMKRDLRRQAGDNLESKQASDEALAQLDL